MLNILKNIWRDPVWASVISATIVAVSGYLFSWWEKLWVMLEAIFQHFTKATSLPNWVIYILCVCTFISLLTVAFLYWQTRISKKSTYMQITKELEPTVKVAPKWKYEYTEDKFDHVIWRWSYNSDNSVTNLISFCPVCDLQIYPADTSQFKIIPTIAFFCEYCNKQSPEIQGTYNELEDKIERLIHRKIRNNTWGLI